MIVDQSGNTERMTRDHRPSEEAELIDQKGGQVHYGVIPRVDRYLAMSRALGDWAVPGLIRRPDVSTLDLSSENPIALVLVSDGVLEGIPTDAQLGSLIFALYPTRTSQEIAARVVQEAYALGSEDNISAVVLTRQRAGARGRWARYHAGIGTDLGADAINGAPKESPEHEGL